MSSKVSTPASVFEKVLIAFETGGFTYADVLEQLRRLLATGASPTQLLEALRHRELAEPMPAYAHEEVVGLLNDAIAEDEAIAQAAAQKADEETALSQISESVPAEAGVGSMGATGDQEVSIDWDDLDHFDDEPAWRGEKVENRSGGASRSPRASTLSVLSEFVRPSGASMSMLAERIRSLEDKVDQQAADQEALTRAQERSKAAESAAVTRAAALAADLTAARAALESEQRKTQSELRTLHDSLSARDAAVVQARRSLDEREAQLAALQKEHARVVPALEARVTAAAQLDIEMQSSKARATALGAELAAARAALELEQQKSREIVKGSAERTTSADAAIVQVRHSLEEREAQLAALQQEHARTVPALEARAAAVTADLQAARARADAISLELKAAQKAAAALHAQLKRRESQLTAARTELGDANAQSSTYLEQLRTHDWRRGFDQNLAGELDARSDAPAARTEAAGVRNDSVDARSDAPAARAEAADTRAEVADARVEAAEVGPGARSASAAPPAAERESATPAAAAQRETTALVDVEDSLQPGDVLMERYRLVAMIGEDRISRVYKATDADAAPDSFVAIKVLTGRIDDDGAFSAFQERIQKLQTLAHRNIVRVFEGARDGSTVFMVMEYLSGPSLSAKLRGGRMAAMPRPELEQNEARSIIVRVADALDYAHGNGVVHGDLKAGNVILCDSGDIKVIDFAVLDCQSEPAADVYALACLAYQVLTGIHPFDLGAGAQPLRHTPRRRPQLSSSEYAAIVHGLKRDTRERTPTVKQFVEEFSTPPRDGALKRESKIRAIAAAAVMLVIAGLTWLVTHHAPPPPPAVQAISKPPVQSPGTLIQECSMCPAMTVLPAGRYQQGSAGAVGGAGSFDRPLHWVMIRHRFAMSTNAVTVDEFQEFIAASGRDMEGCDTYDGQWKHRPKNSWKTPGFKQTGAHPVTCVSWNDAKAYASWVTTKTGHAYRLPSASEWEYAARAAGEAAQPWNPDASGACANANVADASAARRYPGWTVFACDDGYVYTSPVGSFKTNPFGLNDMLGNVFQWTEDCWHPDYTGAPIDGSARTDGDCTEHELRGGSWFSTPDYVRANYRNHFAADYRTSSVGIRLVRDIEQ